MREASQGDMAIKTNSKKTIKIIKVITTQKTHKSVIL